MTVRVRWLIPVGSFALGLYLLHRAFHAYARWQELLALGDPSGAELPETEYRLFTAGALFLILLSAFIAGRWSVRRR